MKKPRKQHFPFSINFNKKKNTNFVLFSFFECSIFFIGAGGGDRTHTSFRTWDFKSHASTIPPHRLETSLVLVLSQAPKASPLRLFLALSLKCEHFREPLNETSLGLIFVKQVAKKFRGFACLLLFPKNDKHF